MRILIVEDDPDTRAHVARGLRESGYAVDEAGDGKEGLYMAMEGEHDAAVVDRMLPGLDGLGLVRALRAAGKDLPVLILSALAEVDDRVAGLRSGGDDYLTKPFAFAELLARVDALQRRRERDGAYLYVCMVSSREESLCVALPASKVCTSLVPSDEWFGNKTTCVQVYTTT